MEKNKLIAIIIFCLLIVALLGAGVYCWKWNFSVMKTYRAKIVVLENSKDELSKQISDLQNRISGLEHANPYINADFQTSKEAEQNKALGRSLRVISPNGGESLCLGESVIIRWEAKGIDAVTVRLEQISGAGLKQWHLVNSTFAVLSESGEPNIGEILWKVGEHFYQNDGYYWPEITAGYSYRVTIIRSDDGPMIYDDSDKVFSILNCKG